MKKVIFYLSLLSVTLLTSCQKGILQEDVSLSTGTPKADVLISQLDPRISQSQKLVDGYLFKTEDFSSLLSTQNLYEVRFVLGYENGSIQMNAVGVNFLGDKLKRVASKTFFEESFNQKFLKLNTSTENVFKHSSMGNEHLLSFKEALKYIQNYRKKLVSGNELNEITLCKGERINHFSLEKKVLSEMLSMNKTENIALFLGVNKEKLTTVFIGMDQNKNLMLPISENDEMDFSGHVFCLTKPFPSNYITNL